jgi:hypothetical protein
VSPRPLVFVSGLTVGDYLLWNWSLNSNHEVLALLSGLTLPPLALAAVSMLFLGVARLLARGARKPAVRRGAGTPAERPAALISRGELDAEQLAARTQASDAPQRRIAA